MSRPKLKLRATDDPDGFPLAEVYTGDETITIFIETVDMRASDVGDATTPREIADLFAAAPDLLEACEEAADDVCHAICPPTWRTKAGQPHNGICLKMRAAIKKARGEK